MPPYCTRSKEINSKKLKDLWVENAGSPHRLFDCVSTTWIIYNHDRREFDYQASTRLEDREDEARAYVKEKDLLAAVEGARK
jgi:hypothetical protein